MRGGRLAAWVGVAMLVTVVLVGVRVEPVAESVTGPVPSAA